MTLDTLAQRIKSDFEAMPERMKAASRFILDHPGEVALLSMRQLAQRAEVTPATMTRLAQRLGFSGFDELRLVFADEVRGTTEWFSGRAVGMLSRREKVGDAGLVTDMAGSLSEYVAALASSQMISRIVAAADLLVDARRIYCIGARASFPVAYEFSHVQNYFWDRAVLLDMPGGSDLDLLGNIGPEDVLLAVSFNPYASSTSTVVDIASAAGCRIVAITDNELSVLGRRANISMIVPTRSPSFFDTITPAFAVGEILMAVMASRVGTIVPEAVRDRERLLISAGVFALDGRGGPPERPNGKEDR